MTDLSASLTNVKPDVARKQPRIPTIHLAAADGTSLRLDAAWMGRLLPDEDIEQVSAQLAGAGEWREEPAVDFLAARVCRPWGRC